MAERICEFRCDPDFYPDGARPIPDWRSKISINLRWVASARPFRWIACDHHMTSITLAGSGNNHTEIIDIAYNDFMALWRGDENTEGKLLPRVTASATTAS
jgi:hypothetical protein